MPEQPQRLILPCRSLPFSVWLALAKATPVAGLRDDEQGLLGDADTHPAETAPS